MPHAKYYGLLQKLAVRKVLKEDRYGVVQYGVSFLDRPKDLDRLWVSKFNLSDICSLRSWPPRNLLRFLGVRRHDTTSYQRSENGVVTSDVPVADVIDLIQGEPRRDSTYTMLSLVCTGSFVAPPWVNKNSLMATADARRCQH